MTCTYVHGTSTAGQGGGRKHMRFVSLIVRCRCSWAACLQFCRLLTFVRLRAGVASRLSGFAPVCFRAGAASCHRHGRGAVLEDREAVRGFLVDLCRPRRRRKRSRPRPGEQAQGGQNRCCVDELETLARRRFRAVEEARPLCGRFWFFQSCLSDLGGAKGGVDVRQLEGHRV